MGLEQCVFPNGLQYGFAEKVIKYYQVIDNFVPEEGRDNIRDVLSLFSPRVCYIRGQYTPRHIVGIEALEHFFRFERTLRGKHALNSVQEN